MLSHSDLIIEAFKLYCLGVVPAWFAFAWLAGRKTR